MLDSVESVLKIIFLILSYIWVGKIMILRSDKQIVINPLLISIAAILVVLPENNNDFEFLGLSLQGLKISLYFIYEIIVLFGLYCVKRKNGVF